MQLYVPTYLSSVATHDLCDIEKCSLILRSAVCGEFVSPSGPNAYIVCACALESCPLRYKCVVPLRAPSLRSRSEENLAPLTTHEDTECLANGEKRAGNMISHHGDQQTYLLKLGEREVMGHQWLHVKPAERVRERESLLYTYIYIVSLPMLSLNTLS